MTTFKLNVKLIKSGSENDNITRLIANCNEGKAFVSPRDLEGYLLTRIAIFPTVSDYKFVKDEFDSNTYHISEDGGKTFTMSIEWVEIYSMPKVDQEIEKELSTTDDLEALNF